jgi:hypothetical protein
MFFPIDIPKVNKKVSGLFKDEFSGIPIREFVGLKSKMYAFRTCIREKKVCKGIKKSHVERIKFNTYKFCLFNQQQTTEEIHRIQSNKLQMYTIKDTKVALSPYDDKKYLINNMIRYSFGHCLIN